jgi:hypothetical protein
MKKKKSTDIDLEQINRHLAAYIEDLLKKNKELQAEIVELRDALDHAILERNNFLDQHLD